MPHKHAKKGAKTAGGRGPTRALLTLGVSDERVAAVPRAVQAPRTFRAASVVDVSTDLAGHIILNGSIGGGMSLFDAVFLTEAWSNVVVPNYDEFYLNEFAVRFVPNDRYSKVTAITGSFTIAYDVDSTSSVLTTERAVLDYGTSKVVTMDDPWEIRYGVPKATTSGQAWLDVASASSNLKGVVLWARDSPLSSSTGYGRMYWEFSITARGRR